MEQAKGLGAEKLECLHMVHETCGHVGLFLIGWLCLFSPAVTAGQQSKPSEYQVKAIYLYNFSRFVEWPQAAHSTNDHFLICILGDNPFGNALADIVSHENVDGMSVLTKQVLTPDDIAGCHVLFISYSERSRLKHILASLDHTSVLTVSDLPQFTEHGGMIQFVVENNHVRFQVNVSTAKRAGLTMSSELLKLAIGAQQNAMYGN